MTTDVVTRDQDTIETVNAMIFNVTMCDGSKKALRFLLKDARLIPDETSLEFSRNTKKNYINGVPVPVDNKQIATLRFNWSAFDLEIIDLL